MPPPLTQIDHSFEEYLKYYKLQFKHFKLVDLDNYMNGNPHFCKLIEEAEWQTEVDRVMSLVPEGQGKGNSDWNKDRDVNIKSMNDMKAKAVPEYEMHLKHMAIKEPMSNYRMPVIYEEERELLKQQRELEAQQAKEEAEAAKKEAEAAKKEEKSDKKQKK